MELKNEEILKIRKLPFENLNYEKIHDGIFVYHNFLPEKYYDDLLMNFKSDDFKIIDHYIIKVFNKDPDPKQELKEYCMSVLKPSYGMIFDSFTSVHVPKGGVWNIHCDNQEKYGFSKGKIFYAGVLYLHDFDGGEVVYPEINVKFKAKRGDLLIHDADIMHYVAEVFSDKRYALTFYVWKPFE